MPIFDLHSHFSFKPANSASAANGITPDTNHWRERYKSKAEWKGITKTAVAEVVKSSQLHGDAATAGGFRVIVNGLYPLESGFIHPGFTHEVAVLTGHSLATIKDILDQRISPFELLQREFKNLQDGAAAGGLSAAGNKYLVVNSHAEITQALAQDPATICIVNSIEGAHAFADHLRDAQGRQMSVDAAEKKSIRGVGSGAKADFKRYIDRMRTNVAAVKSWSHPPFFVSFSHHYYNHLAGHAPSMKGLLAVLCPQTGSVPNEDDMGSRSCFRTGIRSWAKPVLADLLRRDAATGKRRILIDTKHMSAQARIDFYEIADMLRQQGDHLPLVVSHTAVNGRQSLHRTRTNVETPFKDEEESSRYFYPGSINLFDDEIQRVVQSDGLIGLMIDERRIMGEELPPEAGITFKQFEKATDECRKLHKRWTDARNAFAWGDSTAAERDQALAVINQQLQPLLDRLRPAYLSVLFRQLFHIMRQPGVGSNGWYHVALGTDYDGVINPIDIYRQSSDMATLAADLEAHWMACCQHPKAEVASLYSANLFGRSHAHWVERLLWSNGMDFLRKYFNDDYLLHGNPVT